MKNLLTAIAMIALYQTASAQFVAKVQMDEPVEGICDQKNVYAMFPGFDGQVEATCSVSDAEIERMLNEIPFLKANPKYKGEGMIGFYVNCEGEMLECEMDNKTGNAELDAQIEEVFKKLTSWNPATYFGKSVDSRMLYSFEIKKGKLTLH